MSKAANFFHFYGDNFAHRHQFHFILFLR